MIRPWSADLEGCLIFAVPDGQYRVQLLNRVDRIQIDDVWVAALAFLIGALVHVSLVVTCRRLCRIRAGCGKADFVCTATISL